MLRQELLTGFSRRCGPISSLILLTPSSQRLLVIPLERCTRKSRERYFASTISDRQVPLCARRKTTNAKKERELLVVGLKRLLRKQSKTVEGYRALAEMLEGIAPGLLLDWVVIEQEAHHTLSYAPLLVPSNRRPRTKAETVRTRWRWKENRYCVGLKGSKATRRR